VALACELLARMQMLALTGKPAGKNLSGSGYGSSPAPGTSSAGVGAWPQAGPGPHPPPQSAAWRSSHPAG
jgi:hypothetical protein